MALLDIGIYEIENTANGKRYVGSAKSLRQRLMDHLKNLRKGKHHNWRKQHEEVNHA